MTKQYFSKNYQWQYCDISMKYPVWWQFPRENKSMLILMSRSECAEK